MNIKIIGSGCENCAELYSNTCAALSELGMEADIQQIGDLLEIVKLGVMAAPSLMLDGKLVISGRVAPKKEIIKLLKKHAGS